MMKYDWKSYPLSTTSEEVNENFKKLAKRRLLDAKKKAFDEVFSEKLETTFGTVSFKPKSGLLEAIDHPPERAITADEIESLMSSIFKQRK